MLWTTSTSNSSSGEFAASRSPKPLSTASHSHSHIDIKASQGQQTCHAVGRAREDRSGQVRGGRQVADFARASRLSAASRSFSHVHDLTRPIDHLTSSIGGTNTSVVSASGVGSGSGSGSGSCPGSGGCQQLSRCGDAWLLQRAPSRHGCAHSGHPTGLPALRGSIANCITNRPAGVVSARYNTILTQW